MRLRLLALSSAVGILAQPATAQVVNTYCAQNPAACQPVAPAYAYAAPGAYGAYAPAGYLAPAYGAGYGYGGYPAPGYYGPGGQVQAQALGAITHAPQVLPGQYGQQAPFPPNLADASPAPAPPHPDNPNLSRYSAGLFGDANRPSKVVQRTARSAGIRDGYAEESRRIADYLATSEVSARLDARYPFETLMVGSDIVPPVVSELRAVRRTPARTVLVTTLGSFAAGLLLLAAFVLVEGRARSPITPLRLFADRNRSSSYVARLLLVAGMMGMFFFLTQFLRGVLGYSDLKTGFAFLPLTAIVFTASQLSARVLVELIGARRLMIVGITFSTLGMLWLTQLSETSSYLQLAGPLLVFGLGNGLAFVPLTTASLDGVEPADSGAASGLVNVMQQVGGSLGLAVLVTVFGAASSSAAHDVSPSLTPAEAARHVFVTAADHSFWVATAFLAATWLLVVFAIRPEQRSEPERRSEPELVSAAVQSVGEGVSP